MLRGNAADLFLPSADSDELVHLARRMGFATTDGHGPQSLLLSEFQTRTEAVRGFVELHFDRPCPGSTS